MVDVQKRRDGDPEHIREILKRVFVDLEKIYGAAILQDLAGGPDPLDAPTSSGEENQIEQSG